MKSHDAGPSIARIRSARKTKAPFRAATRWTSTPAPASARISRPSSATLRAMLAWSIKTSTGMGPSDRRCPDCERHTRSHRPGVPENLHAIERQHATIAHQDPPGNNRRPDVVAVADIDEMGDRVEHRSLPSVVHGDGDDIRLFALLEAADGVAEAERVGAPARRQLERRRRRQRPRIERGDLLQKCGEAHGLEHVEVVAAGGPVGPESRSNAMA